MPLATLLRNRRAERPDGSGARGGTEDAPPHKASMLSARMPGRKKTGVSVIGDTHDSRSRTCVEAPMGGLGRPRILSVGLPKGL